MKKFEPISALTEAENTVFKVKYASKRFSKMDAAEVLSSAKLLMLKVHIITGWAVPEAELKTLLVDQFAKKIVESYGNVNAEEFEFAFRNNTSVKDWGKAMNLAMLDEVMIPYLESRAEVSRLEERAKLPPPAPVVNIEMTDEELLTATYETWKVLKSVHIIPASLYYFLTGSGKLTLTSQQKADIANRTPLNGLILEAFWDVCKKVAVEDYFKTLAAPMLFKMGDASQWEEVK